MALESKKISLIIRSEKICIEKLSNLEKYGNITLYKKGQKISEVIPRLESDIFKFSIDLSEDIENGMYEFLRILIDKLDMSYLNDKNNDVELRLYLQSFEAQLQISFSNRVIKLLNELNVNFQISILSWGGAIK